MLTSSLSVCELPTAMFITRPAAAGSTAAARFASTTFSTCVKSREVCPSPKIVGRWPSSIMRMNVGMTAA